MKDRWLALLVIESQISGGSISLSVSIVMLMPTATGH
jgi:hypothetical protein